MSTTLQAALTALSQETSDNWIEAIAAIPPDTFTSTAGDAIATWSNAGVVYAKGQFVTHLTHNYRCGKTHTTELGVSPAPASDPLVLDGSGNWVSGHWIADTQGAPLHGTMILGDGGTLLSTIGDGDNFDIANYGAQVTIIGRGAGAAHTCGAMNTLIGSNAGKSLTVGSQNLFIGTEAGSGATDAQFCTCVGPGAGQGMGAGCERNIFIGSDCGLAATTGTWNICIGVSVAVGSGSGNVLIAGGNIGSSGDNNTSVGKATANALTSGASNTFIGSYAGAGVTSGSYNVLVGTEAGMAVTTSDNSVCIGRRAGYNMTSGPRNVLVGPYAANDLTTGSDNVCIGWQAGMGMAVGFTNSVIIGTNAGGSGPGSKISAGNVVAIGYEALLSIGDTAYATAVGCQALRAHTTGIRACALGYDAGSKNTTGDSNTFLGTMAGNKNTTGSNNVFVGTVAGTTQTTASQNTFVGASTNTASATAYSNSTALGYQATITAANQMMFGNGSVTQNVFHGSIDNMGTTGGLRRMVAEAVGSEAVATTFDIAVNVPAGARIVGVQLRVDVALSRDWTAAYLGGPTSAIITAGTDNKNLNSKANVMFGSSLAMPSTYSAVTDVPIALGTITIRVTGNGGDFSATTGRLRAIVYYEYFTAMGDAA